MGDLTWLLVLQDEPEGIFQMFAQLLAFLVLFGLPMLGNRKSNKDKRAPGTPKPARSKAERKGKDLWRELLEQARESEGPRPRESKPSAPRPASTKPTQLAPADRTSQPVAPQRRPPEPTPLEVPGPKRRPPSELVSESEVELPSAHFGEDWSSDRQPLVEFGRPLSTGLDPAPSEEALERGLAASSEESGLGGLATGLRQRATPAAYAGSSGAVGFVRPRSAAEWRRALVLGEVLGTPVSMRDSGPGDLVR